MNANPRAYDVINDAFAAAKIEALGRLQSQFASRVPVDIVKILQESNGAATKYELMIRANKDDNELIGKAIEQLAARDIVSIVNPEKLDYAVVRLSPELRAQSLDIGAFSM